MRLVLAAAALFCATCGQAEPPQPYDLIPGTFDDGRQPDGNSIVLDAPDGLIVIDTGRHREQQDKILAAAKARSKPVVAIVNTHWHLDHSGGNQEIRAVYPAAQIITSRAVEGALSGFLADSRKGAEAYLASGKASAAERAEIAGDLAAVEAREHLLPTDAVTKSERRTVAGRPLEIHLAEHAATAGDIWLYDPASRTVFAGDLVVAFAPFMDTACPEGWLAALAEITKVPFQSLIPGHGAPMDRAAFAQWTKAFRSLLECSASAASDAECIAGWKKDAASFLRPVAPAKVDALIGYYLKSRLRAAPAERNKYCPKT